MVLIEFKKDIQNIMKNSLTLLFPGRNSSEVGKGDESTIKLIVGKVVIRGLFVFSLFSILFLF